MPLEIQAEYDKAIEKLRFYRDCQKSELGNDYRAYLRQDDKDDELVLAIHLIKKPYVEPMGPPEKKVVMSRSYCRGDSLAKNRADAVARAIKQVEEGI